MIEKSKNIILKKNFIHYLKPFLAKHNYKKILIVKGNKSFEKSGANGNDNRRKAFSGEYDLAEYFHPNTSVKS